MYLMYCAFSRLENDNFQMKNCDILLIFAQSSNENPQSMFYTSNNKKDNVYPCKPQFYCIKVGCKGCKSQIHDILIICFYL